MHRCNRSAPGVDKSVRFMNWIDSACSTTICTAAARIGFYFSNLVFAQHHSILLQLSHLYKESTTRFAKLYPLVYGVCKKTPFKFLDACWEVLWTQNIHSLFESCLICFRDEMHETSRDYSSAMQYENEESRKSIWPLYTSTTSWRSRQVELRRSDLWKRSHIRTSLGLPGRDPRRWPGAWRSVNVVSYQHHGNILARFQYLLTDLPFCWRYPEPSEGRTYLADLAEAVRHTICLQRLFSRRPSVLNPSVLDPSVLFSTSS